MDSRLLFVVLVSALATTIVLLAYQVARLRRRLAESLQDGLQWRRAYIDVQQLYQQRNDPRPVVRTGDLVRQIIPVPMKVVGLDLGTPGGDHSVLTVGKLGPDGQLEVESIEEYPPDDNDDLDA
jgi:hypothetical protein